ncbi:MAG: alpha/beta fold hydrolase [Candidatus Lokiarchaeota archaeon]|nr:alpha/beta fold hydrolase [Candidatus Lokiarchaeota archaeon]
MYVQLDKIRLHYHVVGEGRPILFLHGLVGISNGMMEIFEPIFENLSGWKRYYLDSPGNGDSEAPDWIHSSDQVLDVVEQFITKVIGDDSFCLVGYSFGGYLSLGLATRQPNKIDGLLLLCPLIEPDESKRHKPHAMIRKIDVDLYSSLEPQMKESIRTGVAGIPVVEKEVLKRGELIYNPAFEIANMAFLERIKSGNYSFSFDIFQMPVFEKPTLILTGAQDNSVGYRDAWKIKDKFLKTSFVLLDAAGHGLPLDQSVLFDMFVHEWIDRIIQDEKIIGLDFSEL